MRTRVCSEATNGGATCAQLGLSPTMTQACTRPSCPVDLQLLLATNLTVYNATTFLAVMRSVLQDSSLIVFGLPLEIILSRRRAPQTVVQVH